MAKTLTLAALWVLGVAEKTHSAASATAAAKRTLQAILAQVGTEVTPGVEENVRATIHQMNEEVKPAIIQGHSDTQAALDAAFEVLNLATGEAVTLQAVGTQDDRRWDSCVGTEVELLRDIEVAEQSLADSTTERDRVCEIVNSTGSKDVSHTLSALQHFECKHDIEGGCEPDLQAFQQLASQRLAELQQIVAGRVAGYGSNVQMCTNMESEVVEAQNALATATSAFTTQSQSCSAKDSERSEAICAFGSKLQSKCSLSSDFLALVDQVNTRGTVHSSEDRDTEIETSHIVSCALQHFIDSGVSPGDNEIEACRASTPDLGDLHMYTKEFESTLSSFSCNEQSFTFSDASWTIPRGDDATSGQYQRTTPFSYEFSVTTGSPPFPLCSAVSVDPCQDDQSCECFIFRDPQFCNTCGTDCGPCLDFCLERMSHEDPQRMSLLVDKVVHIESADHAGLLLSVEGASTRMGAKAVLSSSSGDESKWIFRNPADYSHMGDASLSDGDVVIENVNSPHYKNLLGNVMWSHPGDKTKLLWNVRWQAEGKFSLYCKHLDAFLRPKSSDEHARLELSSEEALWHIATVRR